MTEKAERGMCYGKMRVKSVHIRRQSYYYVQMGGEEFC